MTDKPTNQVSKKDKLVYSKVYSSKGLMKLDKETEKRFDEQFLDAGEWRHSPITQNEIKQFLTSEKELSRQEGMEEGKNELAGTVNGTPCFQWMDSWTKGFEKANTKYKGISKKISEWIGDQPMCG